MPSELKKNLDASSPAQEVDAGPTCASQSQSSNCHTAPAIELVVIQSLRLCPRRGDRTVHERGAAHETPTHLLAGGDAHDAAEEESKLVKEEEAESERK